MDTQLEGDPYVAIKTDLLLEILELAKTLGQRWLSIRFDHENRHVVVEQLPPDRVAKKIMSSGLSEESAEKLIRGYLSRVFELYEVVWFDREWHEKNSANK